MSRWWTCRWSLCKLEEGGGQAARAAGAPFPPRTPLPTPPPTARALSRYVGEWFETKGEHGPAEPLHDQRKAAVHNLWVAAGMYGAIGVLSGVMVCTHKLRGRL